ncbi:MAG: tetratricopeptide repeat protein, partial [bacterium]
MKKLMLTIFLSVLFAGCASTPTEKFEKGNSLRASGEKEKARKYFEKACEENHYEACAEAASLWRSGDSRNPENIKAYKLYRKACKGDYLPACVTIAEARLEGKMGIFKDISSAGKLFERLCKNEHGNGCRGLAELYAKGLGNYEKDVSRAKELFDKACNLGSIE